MSDWKKNLMQQGLRMMSDPRFQKVMADERVMKAMMMAMSLPGKAQTFARDQVEGFAKAMALATEGEVKDLQRTVRKLEEEVARLRVESTPTMGTAPKKKATSSNSAG
jgi:hypothetical protein